MEGRSEALSSPGGRILAVMGTFFVVLLLVLVLLLSLVHHSITYLGPARDGPDGARSCFGRCDTEHDGRFPCQCDDGCLIRGECCMDFYLSCDGSSGSTVARDFFSFVVGWIRDSYHSFLGPVTDDELRAFAEFLLEMDQNNVGRLLKVNLQGHISETGEDAAPGPLFAGKLPDEVVSIETVSKMMALFNNYKPNTTEPENETSEEKMWQSFLDSVISTPIVKSAHNFLVQKGAIQDDEAAFEARLRAMWFDMYPRVNGTSPGSSGFEHVFMGEQRTNSVIGFHGWLFFYAQEQQGRMDYLGYKAFRNLTDKGILLENSFNWDGKKKPISSMFIGASPELEMALFTVCFVARPGLSCPIRLGGEGLHVETHVMEYAGESHVGTAFFNISG
ncbi:unnamed protein product [Darwinula stevensoni]|uniref:Uncharacterized protein n=1 Tax=Darwinula stevensoni TaxID=69355 RepID=A0A7R9FR73_9CRUS|nr:unnamed protein product [Darwinula stevensoni]CAG0901123.1 unnamed protein product [Darwinula stevensoni]